MSNSIKGSKINGKINCSLLWIFNRIMFLWKLSNCQVYYIAEHAEKEIKHSDKRIKLYWGAVI